MITDAVFTYSTAQNAFCCLVGAILKILCPRERRVFQSKLGVSSSNQCNLQHSPHTGQLGKKIKKGYNLFRTRCTLHGIVKVCLNDKTNLIVNIELLNVTVDCIYIVTECFSTMYTYSYWMLQYTVYIVTECYSRLYIYSYWMIQWTVHIQLPNVTVDCTYIVTECYSTLYI